MKDNTKEILVSMLLSFSMIGLLQLSCFITIILFPDNLFALFLTMHLWSMFAMNLNRFWHRHNIKQIMFGFFLWEIFIYMILKTLKEKLFKPKDEVVA